MLVGRVRMNYRVLYSLRLLSLRILGRGASGWSGWIGLQVGIPEVDIGAGDTVWRRTSVCARSVSLVLQG